MTKPFRIAEPGFYPDLSARQYHADPCPAPSLSQSVAKILIDKSPLHAWHGHPRLNPLWREDDDTKFDVGNIAHKMLIGRGKEIEILDFDDWRTAASKIARSTAHAAGKLAVLSKHAARAAKMVAAAHEQLKLRGLDDLFSHKGDGEVCLAWQEGDVWMRQLIDWLSADCLTFSDYKTTEFSVAPQGLGKLMTNAGWPIQAAMGARGLDVLHPQSAGRRRYLFVVQEAEEPYQLNVVAISEAALTMGRKRLDIAVDIWRRCVTADRWPGYPLEIVTPEMPGWAEQQWLDHEIQHAARSRVDRHADNLVAG